MPMVPLILTEILTPSLKLRPFRLSDTEKVFAMSIESGMKKWIPDQVYRDSSHAEEVLQFLIEQYEGTPTPRQNPIVFGICLKATGTLIGHVGLSPCQDEVEIGYAIETSEQGKGYATEAVRAMSDWGLQAHPGTGFGLSHIVGIVSAENQGSCRVLEKAGFTLDHEEQRQLHDRFTVVRSYRRKAGYP